MAVQKETLRIEGMGCSHCVKAVEEALGAIEGVVLHGVEIGSAQVSYDPETTEPARLAEAIAEAGYTVPALA